MVLIQCVVVLFLIGCCSSTEYIVEKQKHLLSSTKLPDFSRYFMFNMHEDCIPGWIYHRHVGKARAKPCFSTGISDEYGWSYSDEYEWSYSDEYGSGDSDEHESGENDEYVKNPIKLTLKQSPDCPPACSRLSKNDIIAIINFFESKDNISKTIKTAHFPKAIADRDKHVQALKDIQDKLQSRPENLKHILKDIDATHSNLEPIVDVLVAKLQQYTKQESRFIAVNTRVQKVLELLEKYKQLCQYNNCGKTENRKQNLGRYIYRRAAVNSGHDEDYTCGSLKALKDIIDMELIQLLQTYDQNITEQIANDDKEYTKATDLIWRNAKEKALAMCSETMYDVLNLQDEYHHFTEYVKHAESELNAIKKNILEVELKSLELEAGVEKYHKHCLNCKPKNRNAIIEGFKDKITLPWDIPTEFGKLINPNEGTPDTSKESKVTLRQTESLDVRKLIQAKFNEITQVTNNDYKKLYVELDQKINDPNFVDSIIEKLQPIQEEVGKQVITRQEILNKLKSRISIDSIKKICELSQKCKQLLDVVNKAISFINKSVK